MLDINNGELRIKDAILGPNSAKEDFVKSSLFHEIAREDTYGYTRYALRPQYIMEEQWAILLYFNEQQILEMISMSLVTEGKTSSWKSWSEEQELQKKEKHDAWLTRYLGVPPYKYEWGEVTSQYSSRSGSSNITIKYF